jgi:Protein of unknown function (DUF938)
MPPGSEIEEKLGCDGFVEGAPPNPSLATPFKGAPHPRSPSAAASRILPPGGFLCLYGPYRVAAKHISASNRAFDAQLRAMNSGWGVRDLDAVSKEARAYNIELAQTFEMPANNLVAIFRNS